MSLELRVAIISLSLLLVLMLTYFTSNPFTPAQEAFQEALEIFKETLTKDPAKRRLADDLLATSTLGDVLNLVLDAKKRYDDTASQSRIREGLNAFSQRLLYYGNIMDVLVQHHPEYVSLAWGAMKFIFGVGTDANKPLSSFHYGRINRNTGRC